MTESFGGRPMIPRRTVAFLLPLVLLGFVARGDDTPKEARDAAEQKERLELMKRQAAAYEVTLTTPLPTKLTLHGEPLLRFNNAVGGVVDGIAVMWKEGERPAIFAQIFQLKDGLWLHECQSMASDGLTMQIGKVTRWEPEKAAAKWNQLPDGPRAADTAVKRLVQMKAQAARFTAADDFKINSTDRETSRYELRMLPTPVYRYQDAKRGINDGAVFAFVHGTDPELFVILEHRGEGEKAGWYYSLAPMTCWAVQAQLDKAEVWSVPERLGKTTPKGPYHVWVHRPDN
jgi:hypothetical protein